MQGDEGSYEGYHENFMTLPSGFQYSGNWSKGTPNGNGKLILEDEMTFEGQFVNGWREGVGKVTFINGDYYEAIWR